MSAYTMIMRNGRPIDTLEQALALIVELGDWTDRTARARTAIAKRYMEAQALADVYSDDPVRQALADGLATALRILDGER
jgi:hypothetical protein